MLRLQLFGALAVRYVDERDDAADDFAIALHRVRPVLGRERLAIGTEHHFVVYVCAFATANRLVDAALLDGIVFAIGPCVVHESMHVLPDEVIGRVESEQLGAGRVGEGAQAFRVDSEDSFAGRIQ